MNETFSAIFRMSKTIFPNFSRILKPQKREQFARRSTDGADNESGIYFSRHISADSGADDPQRNISPFPAAAARELLVNFPSGKSH